MTENVCDKCGKEISEKQYRFTKMRFGSHFCTPCQIQFNGNYDYNMMKGRMAETIVEQLFIRNGFSVFRYGMENTIPGIMELLKGVDGEVTKMIKRMPDFVVQKENEAYFIEVKYRAQGKFPSHPSDKKALEDYPFSAGYFVVISKNDIQCLSYSELRNGLSITPDTDFCLSKCDNFGFSDKLIEEFHEYVEKFFLGVD